ncbi:DUF5343 domain-containing protein [Methylobacterium sp. J-088]|uniref:DUF5343 domain-containing protein n=1 Tax=Methylobacterium sp. J-088 TaxID=2836664 RepID=UPI001FBA174B|nr:DUF5343 domain-containing protein [Methylobacterium sp. J-088]MCJ2063134.1 DUF5343 domain-containing protein [Methylobacterium sp. J-088]
MADLNLPEFPVSMWWKLRSAFKKSIPKKVTDTYLSTMIGVNEKSASKYLGNFIRIGLLNADATPADIAYDWRDDDKYKEVCLYLLKNSYPEELIEIGQPPDPEEDKIINWISRHEKLGAGAAKRKAAVYIILAAGKVPSEDPNQAPRRSSAIASKSAPTKKVAAARVPESPGSEVPRPNQGNRSSRPEVETSINLNIQIHISADATNSQIEMIFASMAKHLRNQ